MKNAKRKMPVLTYRCAEGARAVRGLRCPLCGKPAVLSIKMFGATIVGCPCVGDRSWAFSFEHVSLPVSRGNLLAFYNTDHDPGDEDRSAR